MKGEVVYFILNTRKSRMNVWDKVWMKDVYSAPELREQKAKDKVNILLKKINIEKDMTVIDIGCGGGYVSRELFKRTGAKIYGIDSSKEAIRISLNNSANMPIEFKKSDATRLPFEDNFADVILCVGVIEHIKNYKLCLSEIKRVLKNNGMIYVVSSNRDSFIYEQRIIRQKFGFWNYGYQKNWKKEALEKQFINYKFETQYIKVNKGIGNFKIVDILDKIFSSKAKKRGRYIFYIGKNIK